MRRESVATSRTCERVQIHPRVRYRGRVREIAPTAIARRGQDVHGEDSARETVDSSTASVGEAQARQRWNRKLEVSSHRVPQVST